MHSHKISTPTGTPVPDEKVKELSSKVIVFQFTCLAADEQEGVAPLAPGGLDVFGLEVKIIR